MHLSSVSKRKREDEQDGGSESRGLAIQEIFARLGSKGSPVPEIFASADEGHPLTFLPDMQDTLGVRIHQEAVRSGRKDVDARRCYPFSDSESPVKRMSVIIPCHSFPGGSRGGRKSTRVRNLSGDVCHQARVPACNGGFVAAVSDGGISRKCAPRQHDPANRGESTRKLAAGSVFTTEPPLQNSDCRSTPVNTKCKNDPRPTILGDVDDGEVRSTAYNSKTLIPLEGRA